MRKAQLPSRYANRTFVKCIYFHRSMALLTYLFIYYSISGWVWFVCRLWSWTTCLAEPPCSTGNVKSTRVLSSAPSSRVGFDTSRVGSSQDSNTTTPLTHLPVCSKLRGRETCASERCRYINYCLVLLRISQTSNVAGGSLCPFHEQGGLLHFGHTHSDLGLCWTILETSGEAQSNPSSKPDSRPRSWGQTQDSDDRY